MYTLQDRKDRNLHIGHFVQVRRYLILGREIMDGKWNRLRCFLEITVVTDVLSAQIFLSIFFGEFYVHIRYLGSYHDCQLWTKVFRRVFR